MGDSGRKPGWLGKLTEGRGNIWLIILLTGLLLLVISIPTEEKKGGDQTGGETAAASGENTAGQSLNGRKSAEALEKRLKKVLTEVEGVGEVEVMITLRSSGESIVEKDSRSLSGESEQNGEEKASSVSSEQELTTVYQKADGEEIPYVKEVMEPEVEGVVVAAQGGENPVTAADITEAVQALFGIEAHKIKVMKRK